MKKMLIERLDSFSAAPFTIQRISELLADPRKQYSRIDKFMRAVEKNILVVSTVSPGRNRSEESENGDSLDSVGLNGDFSSDVNVDIDMENDGSFTMTKEFNATTIRKEPSHDITTETQETVTIKKVASKEEEASTSTIAASNGEALEPTQTEITIENSSTVTITVCEPSEEPKSVIEEPKNIKSDENVETIQKTEESVIKSDIKHEPITLLTENVEPKIDDALLNEPLRPADDEILPESPETTPLAALENIVANRVEVVVEVTPRIEEQILPKQDVVEPKIDDIEETPKEEVQEVKEPEPKIEDVPEIENMPTDDDDSGIEAKRIKIEEVKEVSVPTNITEEPTKAPEIVNESAAVIEEPPEVQVDVKEPESVPENTEIPAIDEPIIEPVVEVKEIEDIPVTAADQQQSRDESESIPSPVIVQPPTVITEQQPIIQVVEGEMEAVPINTENNMALDEDVSTPQIPQISQEIPEMEMAQTANKMDTDDNEGENVLMDTDETEEPMDQ